MALKNEVGDEILAIFIAILFFQSIPRLPYVAPYLEKYPWIVFGVAVLLLLYRKKIISFISRGGK